MVPLDLNLRCRRAQPDDEVARREDADSDNDDGVDRMTDGINACKKRGIRKPFARCRGLVELGDRGSIQVAFGGFPGKVDKRSTLAFRLGLSNAMKHSHFWSLSMGEK